MVRHDLINKLCDPSIVERYERIHKSQSETNLNGNGELDIRLTASESTKLPQTVQMAISENDYPNYHYLKLRHMQNTSWATAQFDRGISYAKAALNQSSENSHALVKKAEACYKEGLEMIPCHVQILTAYGALCINDGRLEMARDLLGKAIRCGNEEDQAADDALLMKTSGTDKDRTIEDAQTYLSVVESKIRAQKKIELASKKGQGVTLSNKAAQAMNDALAEKIFTEGDVSKVVSGAASKANDKYQLLSSSSGEEDDEESSVDRRRTKHSKRKRRRREKATKHRRRRDRSESRRRRKRRERYDSGSEMEDDSSGGSKSSYISDSSCHEGERRRRKHRKRRSKRKRSSRSKR